MGTPKMKKRSCKEMTEKRYVVSELDPISVLDMDTGDTFPIADGSGFVEAIVGCLNALHEENQRLKQKNAQFDILIKNNQLAYIDLEKENEQLQKELDYIQNSITEHIKHQKTELGQKALKEIIKDYNEWLLGHKELKE